MMIEPLHEVCVPPGSDPFFIPMIGLSLCRSIQLKTAMFDGIHLVVTLLHSGWLNFLHKHDHLRGIYLSLCICAVSAANQATCGWRGLQTVAMTALGAGPDRNSCFQLGCARTIDRCLSARCSPLGSSGISANPRAGVEEFSSSWHWWPGRHGTLSSKRSASSISISTHIS